MSADKLEYDRWDQVDMSSVVYEQAKYSLAHIDPFSYVPESQRAQFEEAFNLHFEDLEALGYERGLEKLNERGLVSEIFAAALISSFNAIHRKITGDYYVDFDSVMSAIEKESNDMKTNFSLSLEERKSGLAHLSVLGGVMQYLSEIYPSGSIDESGVQLRSCTFADRVACIFVSVAWGALIGVAAALIVGAASIALAPGTGAILATGTVVGADIFLLAGAVAGLARGLFSPSCCKPEYECYFIEGVSTRFFNCEPTAEYIAYGFGSQAENLRWVNEGGDPPAITTPVTDPRATITQLSNTVPVVTTILTECDDDSEIAPDRPITRNLFQLSRQISDFYLAGQDQIYPGETYLYTGVGGGAAINYSIRWFVNGGTIVSTGNRDVSIRWDEGMTNGWVQMEVSNSCTGGQFQVFTLNVTGDGPIP